MARRPYVSRVYQMGGRRHATQDLGATLKLGQLLVCGTLARHSIQHGISVVKNFNFKFKSGANKHELFKDYSVRVFFHQLWGMIYQNLF